MVRRHIWYQSDSHLLAMRKLLFPDLKLVLLFMFSKRADVDGTGCGAACATQARSLVWRLWRRTLVYHAGQIPTSKLAELVVINSIQFGLKRPRMPKIVLHVMILDCSNLQAIQSDL